MCRELCENLALERADQLRSNRSGLHTSKRLIKKALFASALFAGFAAVIGVAPATAEEGDYGFDDSGLDGIDGDVGSDDGDGDADDADDADDGEVGDNGFGSYDFDGYGIDGLDSFGEAADTGSAGLDEDDTKADESTLDPTNLPPGTIEISYEEMQALMERDLGPRNSMSRTDDETLQEPDKVAQVEADIAAMGLEGIVTVSTKPSDTEGGQRVDLSNLDVAQPEPELDTPVDTSDLPSNDPARTVTWTEQFFYEDPFADTYDINEEAARAQPGDEGELEEPNTVVDRAGNNVLDRDGNPIRSGLDTETDGGDDSVSNERPVVTAGPCVDNDGDGWGWDGSKSCQTQNTRPNHPRCVHGQASDSDGDGWGWENHKSCLV